MGRGCKMKKTNLTLRTFVSALMVVLMSACMAVTVNAAGSVKANALSQVAKEIDKSSVTPTTSLANIYSNDYIESAPGINPGNPDPALSLLKSDKYTIVYKDAIDYFDKKLSLKVEVSEIHVNNTSHEYTGRNMVAIVGNKIHMYLNSTADTDTGDAYKDGEFGYGDFASSAKVTYTFLDGPEGEPAAFTGLIGIQDIDGSHYRFSPIGKNFYYIDAYGDDANHDNSGEKASDHFLVTEEGIFRDLEDPSGDDYDGSFNNASIYVSLSNETSFSFTTQSRSDEIIFPDFYTWNYKINYDANGGSGTMESEIFTNKDEKFLSKENEFTRTGYKFIGFSIDKATYESAEELVTSPEDFKEYLVNKGEFAEMTLYAQWVPIQYEVLYDANRPEGTVAGEDNVDVEDQKELIYDTVYQIRENTFTTDGYKFIGWNDAADKSGKSYKENEDFSNLTTEDGGTVTIYAQWEPIRYEVLYDANRPEGAKAGVGNVDVEDQTDLKYDETYNIRLNTFTTEGYSFKGWNDAADNSGKAYGENAPFTNLTKKDGDTITIYAQWEPWKYTIKYDANGGTGTMNDQNFVYQDDVMKSKENAFTRDGYKFVGFVYNGVLYTNINDFRSILVGLGPNSEITLVAQWEKLPVVPYVIPVTGVE